MRAARALLCVALLAAATLPGTSRAEVPASDEAEIAALLEERARAVRERDVDAFMATVARSSPGFAARQRRMFERMARVPLERYELVARWDRFGDLARPSDEIAYPEADAIAIPVTEERYRIKGFDREDAVEDMFYTFVHVDGRWLIAEDTDLDDATFYSARHLWDFGPLYRMRSEHFLLFGHPCTDCRATSRRVLTLAEQGLDRMRRYWPAPWSGRVVILVPDDEEEVGRILQSTFDLDEFVAFAYSTVDTRRGLDFTGHRIVLNPGPFDGRSDESTLTVMAHELMHIATRDAAGPFVPIFVDEGFADYAGSDADPGALAFFNSEVAAGLFAGELPGDHEFTIGDSTDIYRSYQASQSAVRYFIERYGLERFVRFYRKLGRRRIVVGTARHHLDEVLRDVVGAGYGAFERAWADSISSP